MSAFFDYIRNITYYLLFASLVGLIAPTGKYKKYVSWVIGLVLLVLLLQPLRHIIGTQIPVTQWFEGLVSQPIGHEDNSSYENWRDSHLAAAFEEQLHIQITELLNREGITVHDSSFAYTEDFSRLTSVQLVISQEEQETRRVPFIRIEPVQIQRDDPPEDPLIDKVKNLISGFYNLPHSHIYVEIFT